MINTDDIDVEDLIGQIDSKAPKKTVKAAPAKPVVAKSPTARKMVTKPLTQTTTANPPSTKPATAKKSAKPVIVVKATAKRAPPAPVAPAVPKNFIVFAHGEREALAKQIKRMVKKPTNTRELCAKLEIHPRKLRRVVYEMDKRGQIVLVPGPSRKLGMFVHPALPA
jgi:hypothetical protein